MIPVVIGLIGGVVILLYSGGPIPVSYLPIGEIVSGVVMGGLIPLGIAGCADGKIHWQILFYSLPMILGIALIMMSNNGSDIEKDRKAGRRTSPHVSAGQRPGHCIDILSWRGWRLCWFFRRRCLARLAL